MADDSKKGLMLGLLLGKPKDKPPEDDGVGDEDMDLNKEGLVSAMKDLLLALHKSDPEAMAEAFKDACKLCEGDYDSADGGDEDEGPSLGGAYGKK